MTLARVEIDSTSPATVTVKVDGKDVAQYVVGYDVQHRTGGMPNVTLHMVGLGRVNFAQAEVTLPEYATEGLIALGWLPPERVAELRALAEVDQRGDFGAETVQTYIEAILDDTPRGPRGRN